MLCLLITLLITPVVYSMFDDLKGGRAFARLGSLATFAWGWTRANGRLANGRHHR